jgi:hypothetical protein
VGRKNNGCAFRDFIGFVDEDDATLFESRDHMLVMDNLFTDIDRSPIEFERFFNGYDCSINACAVTAWRCEENSLAHEAQSIRLSLCSKLQVNPPRQYGWSLKQSRITSID